MDLVIDVREGISASDLESYAEVSIAFESARSYEVEPRGKGEFFLQAVDLMPPIAKDFDSYEHPVEWQKWDIRKAAMFRACLEGRPVGGAVVVRDNPKVNLLEGRKDLAVLWDLRVAPQFRRQKIGGHLLREATRWARRKRCRELKVESQNNNARACDFYRKHGFQLSEANRGVYRIFPDEIQMIWKRRLT